MSAHPSARSAKVNRLAATRRVSALATSIGKEGWCVQLLVGAEPGAKPPFNSHSTWIFAHEDHDEAGVDDNRHLRRPLVKFFAPIANELHNIDRPALRQTRP